MFADSAGLLSSLLLDDAEDQDCGCCCLLPYLFVSSDQHFDVLCDETTSFVVFGFSHQVANSSSFVSKSFISVHMQEVSEATIFRMINNV